MNIKEALALAIEAITPASPSAEIDAIYLLTHVLKTNTAWLFLHHDEMLTDAQQQGFFELTKKRSQGLPIAYLTKTRGFWALDLMVNEQVLIPRPETELLVELALKILPEDQVCHIADLGTGSGAIALSLAHERPNWQIDAVDLSKEALNIATLNAQNLQLNNIHFYHGSWCQALPHQNYDAIISNPPYLSQNDPHLQQGDLRFEPKMALASGITGLEAYELIIKQAKNYLKPKGLLMLEHGFEQRAALSYLLEQANYQNLQVFDDYQNHPRVIMAQNGC